jgi:hypothetical protein
VFKPPGVPKGDRESAVRNLHLRVQGQVYPIGDSIEGDTPWSMGMDQSAQVTLPIRDIEARLVDILRDEAGLQQNGALVVINGVDYMVVGYDHDGTGLHTLQLEDEVAWRLKQFAKFKSASRARTTRFGFIQSLVDEASRKPYTKMRSFIPEIKDKLKIRKKTADS